MQKRRIIDPLLKETDLQENGLNRKGIESNRKYDEKEYKFSMKKGWFSRKRTQNEG